MTSGCNCIIEFCSDETGELWSTIAEAIVSIALCVVGIILNLKILKKLKIEKRSKPPERKGNVVEPIMRWFCKIQIVAWPLHLLFYWTWKNGFIPSDILIWVCRPLALLVTILCSLRRSDIFTSFMMQKQINGNSRQWEAFFRPEASSLQLQSIPLHFLE